ncbi:MAG TPA: hypothetical protein VHG28_10105 [Longimicrobiaceae bacterium]|nr:hypothetical protein [Longimicrobiaceae bacterium]
MKTRNDTHRGLRGTLSLLGLSVLGAGLQACDDPTRAPGPATYTVGAPEKVVSLGSPENLGIPSGNSLGINDAGAVAGGRRKPGFQEVGFLWTRTGGEVELGFLGNPVYTTAYAINNKGEIVGGSTPAGAQNRVAYIRSPSGEFRAIGPLDTYSFGWDVNESSVVVGSVNLNGGTQAFRWSADRGMTVLPDLGGGFTSASGINDRGEIVGTSNLGGPSLPVAWSATGQLRQLATLGRPYGYAHDINNQGQIAGISADSLGRLRAVLWHTDGRVEDLGTLGGAESMAIAINDHGEVVGSSQTASGEWRAFFWSRASGMLDLGKLPEATYSSAMGINERGQVVGWSGGWVTLWEVKRPGS